MNYTREVFKLFLGMTAIFLGVTSLGPPLAQYQCANCENRAKTDSSINENFDQLFLEEGQIITGVYVKAGQGCYPPDGICYKVVGGGVGFNYVQVERVGDPGPGCQAISHLEICFSSPDPTDTPEEPTATNTSTPEEPTPTDTATPEDPSTPTPTNTEVMPTDTPWPSRTPGPTPTSNGNGRG